MAHKTCSQKKERIEGQVEQRVGALCNSIDDPAEQQGGLRESLAIGQSAVNIENIIKCGHA